MNKSLRDIFNGYLPDLGKLSAKLHPETKIFRTVDFFSVAMALDSGQLRLTKMADFSDKNEGVDQLVRASISSVFGDIISVGAALQDSEGAAKHVLSERSCRFVSCWSLTPESHAMWSMYSPDQCSVRMQTTVGRLYQLGMSALDDSWLGYSIYENADRRRVINAVSVEPVKYVDIHWLLKRLARRKKLAVKLIKPAEWTNDLLQMATHRHTAPRWRPYLDAAFLKGEAYQYEAEVRLTLKLAWSPSGGYLDQLRSEIEQELSFFEENPSFKKLQNPIGRYRIDELKPVIDETQFFASMPPDFIQSICLDPRAAQHKKVFIENYFGSKSIAIEQSKSFGSAYLNLTTYPNCLP